MIDLFSDKLLIVFAVSLLVNALVVMTKKHHIDRSARSLDALAVQAAHKVPTPRMGGLGIVAALLVGLMIWMPNQQEVHWGLFALSLSPIFVAGLAEDLGYGVSPLRRLLAAAVSSALCVAMLGLWVPHTDIPVLDGLFAFAPVAILFTVFVTSGTCHAFNLIDGVNGLASGTGIIVAFGFATIAASAGETEIAMAAYFLIAAVLGFLVFNYPFGKIFLGDAGAYTVGYVLAWFAVFLLAKVETLTTFSVLLVLFWPIADTLLAIYRRRRSGKPAGQPDRLHFHQLVMRTFEIAHFGRNRRHIANPLTSLVILPLVAAPMVAGVLLWDKPLASFVALVVFSALFFAAYLLGMQFTYKVARKVNRATQVARLRGAGLPAARRAVDLPVSADTAGPKWGGSKDISLSGGLEPRAAVDSH